MRCGWHHGISRRGRWLLASAVAAVLTALPLVNIFTFGLTRHARRADVAVVLGARAYADGSPSLALADRVDEAVRAYHGGLVPRLIMSGGIDPHTRVSEARVMRERAVRAGVPAAVIELDEEGASTALTAQNVARLVPTGARVLVVSHYFHLPRTALLFRRQGLRPFTLPARMTRRLLREPWYVLREVPAFYVAWLTG
jgi:vancomycin permeability regulator SanA